jgi:hypothetical protein
MTNRRSAAAGTLKIVIAMIAKSFSLNTHSPPTLASGMLDQWKEGQIYASAKEIVRNCEETVRICAFILTHGAHLHKIVTVRANKL